MRKLFTLVVLFVFSSNAFALDVKTFQDAGIQSSYDKLRIDLEARYQAIYPFKDADYKKVSKLEDAIEAAYDRLAAAKTPASKKLLEGRIKSQARILDRQLTSIEKSKNKPVAPAPQPVASSGPSVSASILYYADSFEGARTSNGNVFKHDGFSAARCDIDLNSLMQVRYDGKGVIVKANDRPNCSKHPDIVDLTQTAFRSLAPLSRGKLVGSFVELDDIPKDLVKEYLPQDYFSNFSIRLDPNLPNMYLPNETMKISGITTDWADETLAYIKTPSGKAVTIWQENTEGNKFEYFFPLSEVGNYQFVVASGRAFAGAKGLTFTVLDPKLFEKKVYEGNVPAVGQMGVAAQRVESGDLTPTVLARVSGLPENTLRSVKIATPETTISRTGMSALAFAPEELANIPDGTKASVQVTARVSSTPFSMDTYSNSSTVLSGEYVLAPAYTVEKHEPIEVSTDGSTLRVKVGKWVSGKLKNHVYVITPSGGVEEVPFDSKFLGNNGSLATTEGASLTHKLTEEGVYLVEVLYDTGFAAYLGPVTNGKVLTVLPNVYDFASKEINAWAGTAVQDMLNSINAIRKKKGLSELVLDANLSKLAQFKSKDMADNNYVGHADSEGGFILETAKRAGVEMRGSVGENVAGGTVSSGYLQAGLLLSGAHRANMLWANWKKVGIWIVIQKWRVSVTQVFWE